MGKYEVVHKNKNDKIEKKKSHKHKEEEIIIIIEKNTKHGLWSSLRTRRKKRHVC
jgi:hypothetical protein